MDDKPSPPMENDDEEDPSRQPGFLARLIKFAGGDSASDDEDVPDIGATAVERALVQNIITMRGQRVEDVMIPRADISAVDAAASLEELTEAFRFGAHSRLPVYRETLDDVIGFVHVKDVALARGFGATPEEPFRLEDHVREMLVAPPSMPTKRLLQRMQASRIHMALVIDEYGGVDGLVTIEDLVEQIVGEIEDEHDVDDESFVKQLDNQTYNVKATTAVDDFNEYFGVSLDEEEFDTVGGLVLKAFGHLPARGEVVEIENLRFKVLNADSRRLRLLQVRRIPNNS